MLAAAQSFSPSSSRRFAAPAVAFAAAAAVAVAPITASTALAAPAPPPILGDVTNAASALANWAASSGLDFVTDPLTGSVKLVESTVGTGTALAGAVGTAGESFTTYLEKQVPGALERAQGQIAAGDFGAAYTTIATTMTGAVLLPALGLLTVMEDINEQFGPLGAGINTATLSAVMVVLGPFAAAVGMPGEILGGATAAFDALRADGPAAALASIVGTVDKTSSTLVEAMLGDFGAVRALVNAVPSVIAKIGDSPWVDAGPFMLPTGNKVSFAPASAATLAASPTALPDFGKIGKDLFDGVTGVLTGLASDGLPSIIDAYVQGLPKGDLVGPFVKAQNTLGSAMLGLAMPLLPAVSAISPYLGPIGAGLDGTQNGLIGTTMGMFVSTQGMGTAFFASVEAMGKALAAGQILDGINAGIGGANDTTKAVLNGLFGQVGGFLPGLVPGLIEVGGGFVDGVTGKVTAPEVFAADTMSERTVETEDESSTPETLVEETTDEESAVDDATVVDEAPVEDSVVEEAPAEEETVVDEAPVEEETVVEAGAGDSVTPAVGEGAADGTQGDGAGAEEDASVDAAVDAAGDAA